MPADETKPDTGPEITVDGEPVGHGLSGMAAALARMLNAKTDPEWRAIARHCQRCGLHYIESYSPPALVAHWGSCPRCLAVDPHRRDQ
jgi:hypothetical protein